MLFRSNRTVNMFDIRRNFSKGRTPVGVLAVLLVLAGTAAGQPRQQSDVTIVNANEILGPKWESRVTWSANAFYQINKRRAYETTVLLSNVVSAYRDNPNADPNAVLTSLNKARSEYISRHTDAEGNYHAPQDTVEAMHTMLNLLGAYGGSVAKAAKPLADEILKWGVKAYEHAQRGPRQIEAQQVLDANVRYSELLSGNVDAAWVLAQDNPPARQVIETLFRDIINASPLDSSADIKRRNPEFKLDSNVEALLGAVRDNKLSIDLLRETCLKQNKALAKDVNDLGVYVAALVRAQSAATAEEGRRQREEAAKMNYQVDIEGARSSVYVLSSLAALMRHPELAHSITIVGNASVQLIDAIHKYGEVLSRPTTTAFAQMASAITVMASGMGVVMAIASLASADQNPDQLILEQLARIQTQLADLQRDMHDRFDRIDLRINQLFDEMNRQFGVLVSLANAQRLTLEEIAATTNRLDRGLLQLGFDLASTEARIEELIKEAANLPLERELSDCYSQPALVTGQFQHCLTTLTLLASDRGLDATRSFPVDDDTILKAASARPLLSSYRYLARIGSERFQNTSMGTHQAELADPLAWFYGVDEYIAFVQARSTADLTPGASQVADLRSLGAGLKSMVTASRTPQFYDALFANFNARAEDLILELNREEEKYARENGGNPFRRGPKIFKTELPKVVQKLIAPCGSSGGATTPDLSFIAPPRSISLPDGFQNLQTLTAIVPQEVLDAETIGVGDLNLCYEVPEYRAEWSMTQVVHLPTEFGSLAITNYLQNPAVRLKAWFIDRKAGPPTGGGILGEFVFDRQITSSKPVLWGEWPSGYPQMTITPAGKDAGNTAVAEWENGTPALKNEFMEKATTKFNNSPHRLDDEADAARYRSGMIGRVRRLMDGKWDQMTQEFYGKLLEEWNGKSAVAVAARRLSAAKTLLESYVALGFPEELEQDETLRSLLFGKERLPSGSDIADSFSDVLHGATAKAREDAWSTLQRLKIVASNDALPSKDTLIQSVRAGASEAVSALLTLGLWHKLSQSEKATLYQEASLAQTPEVVPAGRTPEEIQKARQEHHRRSAVWDMIRENNDNPPSPPPISPRAEEPYRLLGDLRRERLKTLGDRLRQAASANPMPASPMIDDRLQRLDLLTVFYASPQPRSAGR